MNIRRKFITFEGVPSKPVTWAAMASKNTAPSCGISPATSTSGLVVKPQATIKPEMKVETTIVQPAAPIPLPQRIPRYVSVDNKSIDGNGI